MFSVIKRIYSVLFEVNINGCVSRAIIAYMHKTYNFDLNHEITNKNANLSKMSI